MGVKARRFCFLTTVQILAVAMLFWWLAASPGPWNTQRYIGTIMAVAGVSLVGVARYQLGKSFSVMPEARELVTRGLYSKIRNPIYVFGLVMLAGLVLVLQKPILWAMLPILVVAQQIRARREARVLEAAFGDAYREYLRKTWF